MAEKFHIKQNDTAPSLLYDIADTSVILTGASVVFNMRDRSGVIVSRATAAIESTTPPTLRYDWSAADTAKVGGFQAEFEVTYSGGKVETYPNTGYISVIIQDDIA